MTTKSTTPGAGTGAGTATGADTGSSANRDLQQVLALWLVEGHSSATDLVGRLRSVADSFDHDAAEGALRDLADAGLVRATSRSGGELDYVRTSLGHEYVAHEFASDSPVAARLAELERLRTDFVATIAHELKTPLTAIRTCVGLLVDSEAHADAEVRQRLLTRVASSTDTMQHLIANLLDLARYRSGTVQLELRWVDAAQLAREAAQQLAPLAEQRQPEVRFAEPAEPLLAYVDRRRLEHALSNVLSNALKFSPSGAVVAVTVRRDGDHAAWDIRDEGKGIGESDQRHLFERFFRGRGDQEGGTGLGLPIALAAVQAHGGSIAVQSEPGRGSTFTVLVPLSGPDEPQDQA